MVTESTKILKRVPLEAGLTPVSVDPVNSQPRTPRKLILTTYIRFYYMTNTLILCSATRGPLPEPFSLGSGSYWGRMIGAKSAEIRTIRSVASAWLRVFVSHYFACCQF